LRMEIVVDVILSRDSAGRGLVSNIASL
jgi:hypothetical protein